MKHISASLWFALCVVLAVFSPFAGADTIVNIDFDDVGDLTEMFNPDSSPRIFNQATGGIGNSGVINSQGGQNTGDVWTSKPGYSVNGPGDTYRLSAFFRLSNSSGHSGLGIATSNVNQPLGAGHTASGIGYIATDEVITIVSSVAANPTPQTFEFRLGAFEVLFSGSWYHFEVTIVTKESPTFDISIAISESDSNGFIGSVVTIISERGIVNDDLAQASKVHPYLSINSTSGSRFDRVDDLNMRLTGGPVVVPDPEADSDNDGTLDTVDNDDDGDGVNDSVDTFPLDETESVDTDGDGIGDTRDIDDDNDGVNDDEDAFPTDPTETLDSDGDGVGDNTDAFPFDPEETVDTDGDGVGDNADAFPLDPDRSAVADSDGDGFGDDVDEFPNDPLEHTDSDGDGVGDNADAFPNDPAEWLDSDNDDVGDNSDAFPDDPAEWLDSDADGFGDNADAFPDDAREWLDSDGDGFGDNADAFPDDATEWLDSDGDDVGDNADVFPDDPDEWFDSDGDTFGDNADAFPDDASEWFDSDGDNVGDNSDVFPDDASEWLDSDGDTFGDNIDAFPEDATEWLDSDGDTFGDNTDVFPDDASEWLDSDGDTFGDNTDVFPDDASEWLDSDGDTFGDNIDAFPEDATEWLDSDGDGVGDNTDVFPDDVSEWLDSDGDEVGDNGDAFPEDATEWLDTDNDNVGDNADAFPQDATEWLDSDGDSVGDNADAFPEDVTEWLDTDNDGVGDNTDAFPEDPSEIRDSDNDGIGDNADPTPLGEIPPNAQDTDNDGVANSLDAFPDDPDEWLDSDGDGVGDRADAFDNDPNETMDSDGDGVGDNADLFPDDPDEQTDIDADGIGDNADTDNDNDGTPDSEDAFPLDPDEQLDTDADGFGNAIDIDDDNDGVRDTEDAFPLLASEQIDTDDDGLGNNADPDDDNDNVADLIDAFPLDADESSDTDGDGIGNNADTDDDNDGYSDTIEMANGSDSLNAASLPAGLDIDRDTLADSLERGSDADGDGIGNEFDVDSDNDGIFDLLEASANPSQAAALDQNNDGMMDATQVTGLTRVDVPVDSDGDGIRDYRDLDSDNDGISDLVETTQLTNDFIVINGLQSDQNSQVLADPDGDLLVNYRDLDSDNDGIPDLQEAGGTDTDNDGLVDNFLDLNADGLDDAYFSVPLLPRDSDADGIQDYLDLDSDNDGQFDITLTNLMNADRNEDGRLDIATDSDGDGIADYADVSITNGPDIDEDGIDDRVDASILGQADKDSDGIADSFDADVNGNGFIRIAEITLAAAEPVVETPAPAPVITTSIGGSGCSIAASGYPDMTLAALLIFSAIYLTFSRLGTLRTLKSSFLVFLSTCLAAGPTLADVQTGLYLGIGGGASRLMPGVENVELESRDSSGSAWNATAGYQLNRSVGVEFEYSDLGSTTLAPIGSIDYQNVNVSALYHVGGVADGLSAKKYSLYGRLGLGNISNESTIQMKKETGTHWLAGAGVQMPLTDRLSLRGEGVYYADDASRAGLSLTYQLDARKIPYIGPLVERMLGEQETVIADAEPESAEIEELAIATSTTQGTGNDRPGSAGDDSRAAQTPQPAMTSTQRGAETGALIFKEDPMAVKDAAAPFDMEKAMETDPAPVKKNWVLSEGAIKRMYGKPDSPAVSAALPLPDATGNEDPPQLALPGNSAAQAASSAEETPTLSLSQATAAELPASAREPVLFRSDSSEVTPMYREQLQPLVRYLAATPDARVTLTGHTDSIGPEEYNQQLSIRRAEAVRDFLLQQGIDRKMIRILGAGEKRPVKSNATPSGRRANRRVAIIMN